MRYNDIREYFICQRAPTDYRCAHLKGIVIDIGNSVKRSDEFETKTQSCADKQMIV